MRAISIVVRRFAVLLLAGIAVAHAGTPQRIVSLSPHATELLFSVGAGDRVVAVSESCDFPEAARRLPKVSGYRGTNVEAVIALKPDLVVAWPGGNRAADLDALRRLGIRVHDSEIDTLSGILAEVRRFSEWASDDDRRRNAMRQANEATAQILALQRRYGDCKDKTYLLPKDYSTVAVYYNRQLFDAAGVPYPRDGWTWAEFQQAAAQRPRTPIEFKIVQVELQVRRTDLQALDTQLPEQVAVGLQEVGDRHRQGRTADHFHTLDLRVGRAAEDQAQDGHGELRIVCGEPFGLLTQQAPFEALVLRAQEQQQFAILVPVLLGLTELLLERANLGLLLVQSR